MPIKNSERRNWPMLSRNFMPTSRVNKLIRSFDGQAVDALALTKNGGAIDGFTGATTSKWYMTDISASVTAYGREGIETSTARTLEFNPRYEVVYTFEY